MKLELNQESSCVVVLMICPSEPVTSLFLSSSGCSLSVCCPHFSPPTHHFLFQPDHFGATLSETISCEQTAPPLRLFAPPLLSVCLWPLVSAGLWILLQPTMRSLLESSWMRFGPAGRDSLDWSTVPSPLPSTDRQATGQGSGEAIISTRFITYIVIGTASFLVLLVSILGFLICRRRRGFRLDGKLDLANVIALEDLQDPERNCELLSSLRRSRGQFPSSSSEQDVSDGVFLMVYLPSPYEQTLTRIARAASTSSSKDVELLPSSPGPETGESEKEGMGTNDEVILKAENMTE
ncbi:uncharacterized protein smim28 [Xiphophorus couchianus]|uniref:uncharacterized protein smim28 n=1 Tax=Xiphophorus couchianus TaxID=32473 RepID=UPI00101666C0|nr:uncharacterized protein LOC114138057 [Xiphophorus couchianus]